MRRCLDDDHISQLLSFKLLSNKCLLFNHALHGNGLRAKMPFEKNKLIRQILLETKSQSNIRKRRERKSMRQTPPLNSKGTIRQGSAEYA
jgi:hypothetical protein